jgi:hypothetical protein
LNQQQQQSEYTKNNLYNLDSENDELDFLQRDPNWINERDEFRKNYKLNEKRKLIKRYDKNYNINISKTGENNIKNQHKFISNKF